jgi:heme-degrading monooxygenase HmoA
MMTVVTHVTLQEGTEPEWDAAMRQRLENATGHEGWVRGQLLIPLDEINKRVVVGTWRSRADWEAWHQDPAFIETRNRLEILQADPGETLWYEVLADHAAPMLRGLAGHVGGTLWKQSKDLSRRLRGNRYP